MSSSDSLDPVTDSTTVAGLTASDVALLTGGDLVGDPTVQIAGVSTLERAGPGELSFVARSQFVPMFANTRASVVLLHDTLRDVDNGRTTRIFVRDPHEALRVVLERLYPADRTEWGVHPSVKLGRGARWRGRISIGPNTLIGPGVTVGEDCVLGGGVVIGAGVSIGSRARIGSGVEIADYAQVGDDVTIQTGARIGGEGFGYVAATTTHRRIPHIGGCVIGPKVEIGANTTIDRGTLSDTVIGEGTKIDNLVHIAHNCRVGRNCLIMAQVGLAGSTILEDEVVLAGQAGLAGHLTVGKRARVAAQSGVIGDVSPGTTVSGYPARDHRDVLRQAAAGHRLARHVKALERIVQAADGS